MPVWADKSSNITGLPGWEDKDAVRFLMTGIATTIFRCGRPCPITPSIRRMQAAGHPPKYPGEPVRNERWIARAPKPAFSVH